MPNLFNEVFFTLFCYNVIFECSKRSIIKMFLIHLKSNFVVKNKNQSTFYGGLIDLNNF